jgi:hypothetical protein
MRLQGSYDTYLFETVVTCAMSSSERMSPVRTVSMNCAAFRPNINGTWYEWYCFEESANLQPCYIFCSIYIIIIGDDSE